MGRARPIHDRVQDESAPDSTISRTRPRPREHLPRSTARARPRRLVERDTFHVELGGLREQALKPARRSRQAYDLDVVGGAGHHVQRLDADRAGGTKDHEPFHAAVHDGRGRVTIPVTSRHYPGVAARRPTPTSPPPPAPGDRAAFGTLVERHQPALLRDLPARARRSGGRRRGRAGRGAAGAQSLPGLRNDGAFGPWLCGIGHNLARRTRHTPAPLPLEAAPEPAAPVRARPRGRRTRARGDRRPLAGQRDAVALFYLADLSHAQISARLGISTGAVKTRLHKARNSLQARLADLRRELPRHDHHRPHARRRHPRHRRRQPRSSHVVLLEEQEGARRLPIWIGAAEATTLAAAPPRRRRARGPTPTASPPTCSPRPARACARCGSSGSPTTIFYAQAVLEDGADRRRAAERRDQPRAGDGRARARRRGGARRRPPTASARSARSWPRRSPRRATRARSPTSSGVAQRSG